MLVLEMELELEPELELELELHLLGPQKMRQMGLTLEVRGLDLELLEQLQVAALPAPWGAGLLQLRPVLQQQLPPEYQDILRWCSSLLASVGSPMASALST